MASFRTSKDRLLRNGRPAAVRALCLAGVVLAGPCFLHGHAAAQEDPDWPCIQRKVPHLSVAQLWAGPPLPPDASWQEDRELTRLVSLVSQRRTDLDRVRPMLAELGPAEGRDERLLALFAGVFEAIDRERARVIEGISRFARKQRGLSEQIDARDKALVEAKAGAAPGDHDAADRIEEMQDELDWDKRIFEERQRSLAQVCESPVILERRAFAVAQMIQSELGRE